MEQIVSFNNPSVKVFVPLSLSCTLTAMSFNGGSDLISGCIYIRENKGVDRDVFLKESMEMMYFLKLTKKSCTDWMPLKRKSIPTKVISRCIYA